MLLRYPAYFESFRCAAAACPDSCCKEWDVMVDAETAARYRALPGPLGDALRENLYAADGDTWLAVQDGRCPFWRTDGLCRIQAEAGEEMLCETCREFPRLTHDYGDFVERGLCLACPEAAGIILSAPPSPWICQERPGGSAPDYDRQDMDILLRAREIMLTILENPHYTVPQALALGLLYGCQVQGELDGAEPADFDPEAALDRAHRLACRPQIGEVLDFYGQLEILTDVWRQRLASPAGGGAWPQALRALARYGVERYWLQAVSDLELAARVKMVILSCLLVWQLGGDPVSTAQLYAKEIENDPENVDAILEGAYTSPALTDARLLGWLLLPE